MSEKVMIFGKNTWPFTVEAREAYAKEGRTIDYINVQENPDNLEEMLKYSDGKRKVPVIVDKDEVTIGFKGRTWGV